MKRVREDIISSKNGNKTFNEVYGDSVDLDNDDSCNAELYSHCFESIAKKSLKTKLNESTLKESYDENEITEGQIYDYFTGLSSGRGMPIKRAAQLTVKHFQGIDENFGMYDVANALAGEYDLDDLLD